MRIAGVQVGRPAKTAGMRTGFGKSPVAGDVRVGHTNVEGDGQADRRYHGGADMAVLAYCADHYPAWRRELDWPDLPLGGFGENLSIEGAAETSACIGDVWRAGSAILQISSPRNPCVKIGRYWRRPGLLQRVRDSGRVGWYLRVLEEGVLQAFAPVTLLERPHPGWTVQRAFAAARKSPGALALAMLPALSDRWRAWLRGEPARV